MTEERSWGLTELACDFDFRYTTAMSYRKGYIRIEPDLKVKGHGKKRFSKARVCFFLVARQMFRNEIHAKAIQKFLELLVEFRLFERILAGGPDAERLADTMFFIRYQHDRPEEAQIFAREACSDEQFKKLTDESLRSEWRFTFVSLGAKVRELEARLDAKQRCIDYYPPPTGNYVKMALTEFFAELKQKESL